MSEPITGSSDMSYRVKWIATAITAVIALNVLSYAVLNNKHLKRIESLEAAIADQILVNKNVELNNSRIDANMARLANIDLNLRRIEADFSKK